MSINMIQKEFNSIGDVPKTLLKENKINNHRKKSVNNLDKRLVSRLKLNYRISKQNEEAIKDSSLMNLDIISPCSMKNESEKLFPFKYYFFSIFIKNLSLEKNKLCFSNKFAKVYMFLTQVMDIRNYLLLLKEFNVIRTKFFNQKKLTVIGENNLNIGTNSLMKDTNNLIKDN